MKIFILNPEDSFISIRSFHVQYSLMKPILSTTAHTINEILIL